MPCFSMPVTAVSAVRVLVGNASRMMLEMLAGTLRSAGEFTVVGVVPETRAVLPAVRRLSPGVAVIGAMGSGAAGVALTERVAGEMPCCKVVVVAARPPRTLREKAIEVGATAVVPMEMSLSHLIHEIREAAGSEGEQPTTGPADPWLPELTKREQEILRLTWTGASVKEIARELCLAPGTVRNLTSGCMRKFGARSRFEAARIAMERRYL